MPTVINLKVVLLGESFVGKTAIATRFVNDSFDQNGAYQGTVGASFLSKAINVDDIPCDLAIWDTAGQEVYRTLTPMYYRDAQIALIVFDITQKNTFEQVEAWYKQVKEQSPNVVITICGNKADLPQREVQMNEAFELSKDLNNVPYIETSAKTGAGVVELFETAIQEYFKKNPQGSQSFTTDDTNTVDISKPASNEDTKKGCGC